MNNCGERVVSGTARSHTFIAVVGVFLTFDK